MLKPDSITMLLGTNLFAMLPASEEASYCVITIVEKNTHWNENMPSCGQKNAPQVSWVLSECSLTSESVALSVLWVCPESVHEGFNDACTMQMTDRTHVPRCANLALLR